MPLCYRLKGVADELPMMAHSWKGDGRQIRFLFGYPLARTEIALSLDNFPYKVVLEDHSLIFDTPPPAGVVFDAVYFTK